MSHTDKGILKILTSHYIYRLWQWLIKASGSDLVYIAKYIKPFSKCKLLDIGCGPGTFLEYYDIDIQYDGFDLNQDYIDYARNKYGKRGNFECRKVDEFIVAENKKYDIITANALLHHISDQDAISLFKNASLLLENGGRMITLDPVYIENQHPISKFVIENDRGRSIRSEEEFRKLASPYFSKIESFHENSFYRFSYDLIINVYYK